MSFLLLELVLEHISQLFLVFPLLNSNRYLFAMHENPLKRLLRSTLSKKVSTRKMILHTYKYITSRLENINFFECAKKYIAENVL